MLFASAVTAATTTIRCWIFNVSQSSSLVPDLQSPPFCTTKTTAFPLPLCIFLRIHFYKYHYDRLAPIYSSMELSQPSEISRAAMHRLKFWPNPSTLFKHHQCCSDLVAPATIRIIFSDLYHQKRIGLIEQPTHSHLSQKNSARCLCASHATHTVAPTAANVICDVTLPRQP